MLNKYQHLIYGLLFAFIGLLVGIHFISINEYDYQIVVIYDYDLFVISVATLAGFLSGTLFWHTVIMSVERNRYYEAVLTGVLTGIVSHWFFWFILLLPDCIHSFMFGSISLIQSLLLPFAAVMAAHMTLISCEPAYYGLYTVIGGVVLAVLLMYTIIKLNKAR